VYLITFGSLLAYCAYSWLLKNVNSSAVSTYAYVNPIVAVLLGSSFGGEHITERVLVAGTLVMVGVVLVLRAPKHEMQPAADGRAAQNIRGVVPKALGEMPAK
jgi:drug/metabolite transporter (DMT)-like permease